MPDLDFFHKRMGVAPFDYPDAWKRGFRYVMRGVPADDTGILQDAVDEMREGKYESRTANGPQGGQLHIAQGTINLSATLRHRGGVDIRGQGPKATILKAHSSMAQGSPVISVDDAGDAVNDYDIWGLQDICLDGSRSFKNRHGGLAVTIANADDFFKGSPDSGSLVQNVLATHCMLPSFQLLNPSNLGVRDITLSKCKSHFCGHIGFLTQCTDARWDNLYCWTGGDYATFSSDTANVLTLSGGPLGGFDWDNSDMASTTRWGSTIVGRHYVIGLDSSNVIVIARPITGNGHDGSNNPTITYSGTANAFSGAGATRLELTTNHGFFFAPNSSGTPLIVSGIQAANMRGMGLVTRSSRDIYMGVDVLDVNGDGIFMGNTSQVLGAMVDNVNRRNMQSGTGVPTQSGTPNVSCIYMNGASHVIGGMLTNRDATGKAHFGVNFGTGPIADLVAAPITCIVGSFPIAALKNGTPGARSRVNIAFSDGSSSYVASPAVDLTT